MADRQNQHEPDAASLLAQAEQAAAGSALGSEAPARFIFLMAFLFAAILSTYGLIETALWYWSFLLFLPLFLWYFLASRKRPKPRAALKHSGKYMWAVFLLIGGTQFSNFWLPQTWVLALAKFALLFVVLICAFWLMRRESIKSRIKDGNEHAA